jgi:hypothetical protein
MRHTLSALLLISVSFCAEAQDASLLAGAMKVNDTSDHSFAVGLGYSQRMGTYTALSAEYVNEGHPSQHHRDGLGGQFWLHTATPDDGASFALGVGPYYYFDTTTGNGSAEHYRNDHGWGSLVSASAKWHFEKRSYLEARLSKINGRAGHDSTMLMVGMGYELRDLPREVKLANADPGENLLMVLAGRAVVNSFHSERATATSVEYRRTLSPNAEWSVMYLNEGRVGIAERKGVAAQAWLLRPFTERTVLELGVGGYVMRDQVNRNDVREDPKTHFAPIATIGMRYRISDNIRAQLSWSRVITDYHRDSDLFLLGAGLAF